MSRIKLLQSIEFFSGLSSLDLEDLAQVVKIHDYRAGQLIFSQGDLGTSMYIVVAGHVHIYLNGMEARPLLLQELGRGEHFGELALFDDKPRSACAYAYDDVELLELTRETLSDYLFYHPRTALVILRTMAERLRATDLLLVQRAARNVDEELDRSLTWQDRLADKVATLNGSWAFILILLGISGAWMLVNSLGVFGLTFDPYPYVFFNLVLAILVSLQGPLIVMSQNRKALLERARAEADYNVNLKNEVNIETMLHELQMFRVEMSQQLDGLSDRFQEPQDPDPDRNPGDRNSIDKRN